jgi:hypothetical protein
MNLPTETRTALDVGQIGIIKGRQRIAINNARILLTDENLLKKAQERLEKTEEDIAHLIERIDSAKHKFTPLDWEAYKALKEESSE